MWQKSFHRTTVNEKSTFHVKPSRAGDAITLYGELATIFQLDSGALETVLSTIRVKVVPVAVENLQFVLEPPKLVSRLAELSKEFDLVPFFGLDVIQLFDELVWFLFGSRDWRW